MNQEEINLHQDLFVFVLNLINTEQLKVKIWKGANSEIWLEEPDIPLAIKCVIDFNTRQIFYDFYSTEKNDHVKLNNIKDVEKLEYFEETKHNWNALPGIEDLWLILDEIRFWAYENKYNLLQKQLF